jgi:hypothetical protein
MSDSLKTKSVSWSVNEHVISLRTLRMAIDALARGCSDDWLRKVLSD